MGKGGDSEFELISSDGEEEPNATASTVSDRKQQQDAVADHRTYLEEVVEDNTKKPTSSEQEVADLQRQREELDQRSRLLQE